MPNVTITQLPTAGAITGSELVPIVQNGGTVKTTASALAGSPVQTQTFLTLNNEPTLNNSRYLSTDANLSLTDGGAQSFLRINLAGAAASLNSSGNGFQVKTGLSTVTSRTITTATNGVSISNGDGVSGNPAISLTGQVLSLANASGAGLVALPNNGTVTPRSIVGTASEIDVADGDGAANNPTVGLSDNPVVPGSEGIVVPVGNTGSRAAVPFNGTIRYNTDTATFEGYTNNSWNSIAAGVGVSSINVSGGTTGLTTSGGPVTTTGVITIGGTLITSNGGTGLSSYTAGDTVYYASGTSFSKLPIGTNGQVMTSTGSAPQWTTLSGVAVTTFSAGTTGFTPNSATSGAVTLSGTLITSNGGTGLSSYTAGDITYYASGTAFSKLAIGTANQVLASTGTAPNWVSNITLGTITATTKVVSPAFDAAGSAGGQLRNATGTSQLAWGAGGGSNLSLEVATNINPANASVSIAPTGSGSVTINPATAGTINNMAIGGTTAAAVTGTTITASTQFTGPGTGLTGTATALSIGGNAATATAATNVAGGGANQIVFNTGAGATSFAVAPTVANTFLEWSGSAFQWAANPLGTVTSVNVDGGTTGLTFSGGPVTTSGTITMTGTLAIANGGTNATATPTAGAIAYGTGTAYAFSSAGTASQVLLSGGAGTPTWSNQSSLSVGSATDATNTAITDDTTTNATMYPTWVTASTGNLPQKVTSTKLTFNPSSGILTATGGISGGTF